jgi:uncharacterized membrane protein YdbT with pleckstrin-like domain
MTNSRYLSHDERVVIEVRRHVIVLARSGATAAVAVIAAGTIGWITTPLEGAAWLDTALGLIALFIAARFGWRLWQWWVDRIVVTDQRIFEVSGVLTRKVASMPLTRVTDMTYRRSLGGRLFGYGDLIVESAGQDQALSHINYIPNPDHFYRTITALVTSRLPSMLPDEGGPEADQEDTGPLPRVIV